MAHGIGNNPHFASRTPYASGSREVSFIVTGTRVQEDCLTSPGKDFGLVLRYSPNTLCKQAATITIYHDGNDWGFISFDISGDAY